MPVVINRTWYGLPIFHGPHKWGLRLFKLRFCKVAYVKYPDRSLRLWLYTRKGSGFIEIIWNKK